MKLYIWEGKGITTGYHQDGTLVILASSVEEAREVARTHPLPESCYGPHCVGESDDEVPLFGDHWCDREERNYRDGDDRRCREAIDRPPDRIVDIDQPAVVAFNGGGYD